MIRAVIFDLDNCLSAPSSDTGQLAAPPIVHEALAEPGQPLYAGTRAFMEPRFGHDFSRVRVHSDAKAAESAEAVNARAYTVGSHVVLGEGQPSPESIAGRHLLAHELAHVVQQSRRGTAPVLTASAPHEQEAHAAAIAVAIGLPSVRITCNTGVGVARSNGLHSTEDPIHPTENPTLLAELQEELMAQKQALANAPVIRDILAESGIELTVPLEGNLPPSVIRRALERVVKRGGPYAKEAEPILGELEEIRGHLEILSRRRGLIRMSGAKAEGTAAKVESTAVTEATPPEGEINVLGTEGKEVAVGSELGFSEAKAAGYGAKIGSFLEGLVPGPLDALLLYFNLFATMAEAKEALRDKSYILGFSEGMAARLLQFPLSKTLDMLFGSVFGGSVAERVAGVVAVAEHGNNAGVVDGYAFANRLSSEQKGAFLRKGFTILANKGYASTSAFNRDDVIDLGVALEPTSHPYNRSSPRIAIKEGNQSGEAPSGASKLTSG